MKHTRSPHSDLPIRFEDVSYNANTIPILDRINLVFEAGPPTVLIGPNGSGKTTLLRIAMGLLTPSTGQVTWGGRGVHLTAGGGFVFQRPTMLRRSVGGNIRYALKAASVPRALHDSRIRELLTLVGLAGLAERPARRLSGGEQQHLALARALAGNSRVLFLDEPTASLDPAATKAFEDVIQNIAAQGIKVVMSTHDLGEARRLAGEVVLLHRGQVVETGAALVFFMSPLTLEGRKFLAGDLLL